MQRQVWTSAVALLTAVLLSLALCVPVLAGEAGGGAGDRNCEDFDSQGAAQDFFESEGGPEDDPNRLDADNDGQACDDFDYGASEGSGGSDDSGDRDCPDFESQDEAQNFFESEGGPEDDPNRLDADNDGQACEDSDFGGSDGGGVPEGGVDSGFGGTEGPKVEGGGAPTLALEGLLLAVFGGLGLGAIVLRRRTTK